MRGLATIPSRGWFMAVYDLPTLKCHDLFPWSSHSFPTSYPIPVTHLTFAQGTGESCNSLASSSKVMAHGHPATCSIPAGGWELTHNSWWCRAVRFVMGVPPVILRFWFFLVNQPLGWPHDYGNPWNTRNPCGEISFRDFTLWWFFSGLDLRSSSADRRVSGGRACWHELMATLKLSIVGETSSGSGFFRDSGWTEAPSTQKKNCRTFNISSTLTYLLLWDTQPATWGATTWGWRFFLTTQIRLRLETMVAAAPR